MDWIRNNIPWLISIGLGIISGFTTTAFVILYRMWLHHENNLVKKYELDLREKNQAHIDKTNFISWMNRTLISRAAALEKVYQYLETKHHMSHIDLLKISENLTSADLAEVREKLIAFYNQSFE